MINIKLKMFGKKSVVSVLFYLSVGFTLLFFILLIYNLSFTFTEEELIYSDDEKYIILEDVKDEALYISKENYNEFESQAVLRFSFLSIYFLIISLIFKNVRVESIFSEKVINILMFFTTFSFLPFVYSLIKNVVIYQEKWAFTDAFYGNISYVITGLFSLFIVLIFREGLKLKQENDLTI